MTIVNEIIVDVRGLVRQCGHDVQTLSVNKGVLWICGGPIERASAEAINLNFTRPDISVERLEVIFEHHTVIILLDSSDVHEADESCKREAQKRKPIDDSVVDLRSQQAGMISPGLIIFAFELV